MIVYRAASTADGAPVDGFFEGAALLESLVSLGPAGVRVNRVSFEPGARTIWHTHTDGQLLVVVEGEGVVATGEAVTELHSGDIVWTAAGEEHWHGAAGSNSLVHIAISFGATRWGAAVS
jgi:quercetin dioxygenase-like cupin family protein